MRSVAFEPAPGVADVAIPDDARFLPTHYVYLNIGSMGFARLSALAVRLHAVEPDLNGAAMKSRIMSLAKTLPGNPERKTRAGWIADPMSHFPAK